MNAVIGMLAGAAVFFATVVSAQVELVIVPDGVEEGDEFGCSTAMDGDHLIAGAYLDDDVTGTASGSAYVFARNQGGADSWGLVRKLTAPDADVSDWFGLAVAISGDIAVVGAPGAGDPVAYDCGQVYVFEKDRGGPDNWGLAATLHASDATANDELGHAVAVNGDTLVVGADRDDDGGLAIGSVYIFERDQGGADNWGEVTKLQAADGVAHDHFGGSVAVDGDTLAVGAYGDNSNVGSVYIFDRNLGWGLVTTLYPFDSQGGDWFGGSVAADGDTVAVGAHGHRELGYWSGAVFVHDRNLGGANNWGLAARLIGSDITSNDAFGCAVALHQDTVVAGAEYFDGVISAQGRAYVFSRNVGGLGAWGEERVLEATDASVGDWFGQAVAAYATRVVVGSLHHVGGTGTGAAYLYDTYAELFLDDFESGGTDRWSTAVP